LRIETASCIIARLALLRGGAMRFSSFRQETECRLRAPQIANFAFHIREEARLSS
jgi:hypothetical protein